MPSFWPWRGDASSPNSFEKALSALSAKITNTQAQLDRVRASARRAKVLSTLYLSFAYLVYAIVLLLVVGWRNMGVYEWSGVAGFPVLIYVVRATLATYHNFRIETLSARLKDQQNERAKTIQKLKDATKYDSTLELLQKYGDAEGKPAKARKADTEKEGKEGKGSRGKQARQSTGGLPNRTNLPPPPTANIPRPDTRSSLSAPGTPQHGAPDQLRSPPQWPVLPQEADASAEFAPNAFDHAPAPPPISGPYDAGSLGHESHWYDRILDLLLGEDETAAKNRIVLICKRCHLVNGQAPPGTKSLSEIGLWKCMACGATNGEVDEGKRIIQEVLGRPTSSGGPAGTDHESAGAAEGDDEDSADMAEAETDDSEPTKISATGDNDGPASGTRRRKDKGKN